MMSLAQEKVLSFDTIVFFIDRCTAWKDELGSLI